MENSNLLEELKNMIVSSSTHSLDEINIMINNKIFSSEFQISELKAAYYVAQSVQFFNTGKALRDKLPSIENKILSSEEYNTIHPLRKVFLVLTYNADNYENPYNIGRKVYDILRKCVRPEHLKILERLVFKVKTDIINLLHEELCNLAIENRKTILEDIDFLEYDLEIDNPDGLSSVDSIASEEELKALIYDLPLDYKIDSIVRKYYQQTPPECYGLRDFAQKNWVHRIIENFREINRDATKVAGEIMEVVWSQFGFFGGFTLDGQYWYEEERGGMGTSLFEDEDYTLDEHELNSMIDSLNEIIKNEPRGSIPNINSTELLESFFDKVPDRKKEFEEEGWFPFYILIERAKAIIKNSRSDLSFNIQYTHL